MIDKRFINVKNSSTFNNIIDLFDLVNKKVIDIGCSCGEHLVKFGKGSLGITTSKSEVEYANSKNINIKHGNAEVIDELGIEDVFDVIWANNLFEHLLSPHSFLIRLKRISDRNTTLILGVPIMPKIKFLANFKKFKGFLASNHINFFTYDTLRLFIERAGWDIKEVRSFIFKNKILDNIISHSISPHVYIVATNNTGFKYPDKKLGEWKDESYYDFLLNITKQ